MKYLIILLSIPFNSFSQLEGNNYYFNNYFIIANNDTLNYFHRDSLRNIWNLHNVNIRFEPDNKYNGKSINGTNKLGSWQVIGDKLVLDKDTSSILKLSSTNLILKNEVNFTIKDTTYQTTIISHLINYIYSVNSGNWNNVNSWSCNCIPKINDNVVIKKGFRIDIDSTTGTAFCKYIEVEKGAFFNNNGYLFISKP